MIDLTNTEICDRLDALIASISTDDELVNTFRRDQMKAAAETWWNRFVAEEFGGIEPSWARGDAE